MGVTDILFPKKCLGCNSNGDYICEKCVLKLGNAKQICPMCERPSIDGITHFKCKKPHGLDGILSVWPYKELCIKIIKALKFRFAREISEDISKNISEYLKNEINALPKNAYIVPIPLHKKRENWRGFNQAEVLAECIVGETNWKLIPDLLIRIKQTKPQADLKGERRRKNIRGVFEFNTKYKIQNSQFPYILVDDVYTTGSTIREACKVLKRNGAKVVWGFTVSS